MAFGPNPTRMAHAFDSVAQWATNAGLSRIVDLDVDYLGSRGGYLVVAVTGLPITGDVEAIVSPQGKVRVFAYDNGELREVSQLAATAAA